MNITAEMKNKKKQSKYVVNVSFDIPFESKKLFADKPVSGQFTISPFFPKKKMKIKLGSLRSNKDVDNHKISMTCDTNRMNSARNEKKNSSNKSSANPIRHVRNGSFTHSKSPSCLGTKTCRQSFSFNQPFNIKALKNKIICNVDDEFIKYTNPSIQLKKEGKHGLRKKDEQKEPFSARQPLMTPPLGQVFCHQYEDLKLINEMKKLQEIALQKKEKITKKYKLQKILMQASARKIQRAWRNYKTKKLIKTYSHNLSIKYTNKMKQYSSSEQSKILNVKSCGFNNGVNQMKRKMKEWSNFSKKPVQDMTKKDEQEKKNELMKKIQLEEIHKWEELIRQLRRNKNVEEVLHKIQQQQDELKKQTEDKLEERVNKAESKQSQAQMQRTINFFENNNQIYHQQKNRQSEKNSSIQKPHQNDQQKLDDKHNEITKEASAQKRDNKQVIEKTDNKQFNKQYRRFPNHLSGDYQEKTSPNVDIIPISMVQQNASQKLIGDRPDQGMVKNVEEFLKQQINIQQKIKYIVDYLSRLRSQESQAESDNSDRQFHELNSMLSPTTLTKISVDEQVEFLQNSILYQIVSEVSRQFSFHKNMVEKIFGYAVKSQKSKNFGTKPEGICTNMQSIKDYLQNLLAYIFQECPQILIGNLNQPSGLSPIELLIKFRDQKSFSEGDDQILKIMPKGLFVAHWKFASQLIYFQKRYDNELEQKRRIERLKAITKIYFQSIFDAFNDCLTWERIYGRQGQPFPWQRKLRQKGDKIYSIETLKPKIKSAFRKLSQISSILCGIFVEQKKFRVQSQIAEDIKQQRMTIYLENEISQKNYQWQKHKEEQAEVLYKTANYISQLLFIQACCELQNI